MHSTTFYPGSLAGDIWFLSGLKKICSCSSQSRQKWKSALLFDTKIPALLQVSDWFIVKKNDKVYVKIHYNFYVLVNARIRLDKI